MFSFCHQYFTTTDHNLMWLQKASSLPPIIIFYKFINFSQFKSEHWCPCLPCCVVSTAFAPRDLHLLPSWKPVALLAAIPLQPDSRRLWTPIQPAVRILLHSCWNLWCKLGPPPYHHAMLFPWLSRPAARSSTSIPLSKQSTGPSLLTLKKCSTFSHKISKAVGMSGIYMCGTILILEVYKVYPDHSNHFNFGGV